MHRSYSDDIMDRKSFEHYVEEDIMDLKSAEDVREWKDDEEFRNFSGSQEVMMAWEAYIDSLEDEHSKSLLEVVCMLCSYDTGFKPWMQSVSLGLICLLCIRMT